MLFQTKKRWFSKADSKLVEKYIELNNELLSKLVKENPEREFYFSAEGKFLINMKVECYFKFTEFPNFKIKTINYYKEDL